MKLKWILALLVATAISAFAEFGYVQYDGTNFAVPAKSWTTNTWGGAGGDTNGLASTNWVAAQGYVTEAITNGLWRLEDGTNWVANTWWPSIDASAITAEMIGHWDDAFGWGDHAGLYDLVGSAAAASNGVIAQLVSSNWIPHATGTALYGSSNGQWTAITLSPGGGGDVYTANNNVFLPETTQTMGTLIVNSNLSVLGSILGTATNASSLGGDSYARPMTYTGTLYSNIYRRVLYDAVTDHRLEASDMKEENINYGTLNYYVTNGMSWADIRTLIYTIPKWNYGTINVYFEDGTYVPDSTSAINFDDFRGSGTLTVWGNTNENYNAVHTNQAVVFDASTNRMTYVIQFYRNYLATINVRNLKVKTLYSGTTAANVGIQVAYGHGNYQVNGCFVEGMNTASNNYGFQADTIPRVNFNYCTVAGMRYGFTATLADAYVSYCASEIDNLPAYGVYPNGGNVWFPFSASTFNNPPLGSTEVVAVAGIGGSIQPQKLWSSKTIYMSNTWSKAICQGVISALPRDLDNNALTLQFQAGTYLFDTPLYINGFHNGTLQIYGVNDGSGAYTNQTTIFQGGSNQTVVACQYNTAMVRFSDIAFNVSNTTAHSYGLDVWANNRIYVDQCYFKAQGSVSYTAGFRSGTGNAKVYNNYFKGPCLTAIYATETGIINAQANYRTGSDAITYGHYVVNGGKIQHYDALPLGTKTDYALQGGVIIPSTGFVANPWVVDVTLWANPTASWAQRVGSMPQLSPRTITSLYMRTNVSTGTVQVCHVVTNGTMAAYVTNATVNPTTSGAYGTISSATIPSGAQVFFNITGYSAASYTTQTFWGGISGTW